MSDGPTDAQMVEHLDGQVQTLLRENDRLRWALEEIIQAATPGSSPWVVIPDHLIEQARAALTSPIGKEWS